MGNLTNRSQPTKRLPDQYGVPTSTLFPALQDWPRATTSVDASLAEEVMSDAFFRIDALDHQTSGAPLKVVQNLGTVGPALNLRTGSTSVADSNDPKFLDHTGTNYVYLPGVNGNYLSTPDAAALDITGDIDLRAYVAMDDWTPAANQALVGKWNSLTNQRSYLLGIGPDGKIRFNYSTAGTAAVTVVSTVAPTIADGATKWIRATFDVDNGASGNTATFYTSDNGTTWTQVGDAVVNAGVVSIFSGSAVAEVGAIAAGQGDSLAGKIFRAQIFDGIDGTKVLDVDTSKITSGQDTFFIPVTYSGGVGARFTGSGLSLPGTAGNYVTAPDSAALDITGDIDIRIKMSLDDWTPSAFQLPLGKWTTGTNQRSYVLQITNTGLLDLTWSTLGTGVTAFGLSSSVATGITDGATKWVRATLDVDNGAGGYDVKFYLSDDGSSWTQLGTTRTGVGTTSIFSGSSTLEIGSFNGGINPIKGVIYRTQILNGINGTMVFDADFETVPEYSVRMIERGSGAVVSLTTTYGCTINRSTSGRKTVAVTAPCWLFGTDDFMQAPFHPAFRMSDKQDYPFTMIYVTRRFSNIQLYAAYMTTYDYTLTNDGRPGVFLGSRSGVLSVIMGIADNTGGSFTTGGGIEFTPSVNTSGQVEVVWGTLNLSKNTATAGTNLSSNSTVSAALPGLAKPATTNNGLMINKGSVIGPLRYQETELRAAMAFRRELSLSEISAIYNYYQSRWPQVI